MGGGCRPVAVNFAPVTRIPAVPVPTAPRRFVTVTVIVYGDPDAPPSSSVYVWVPCTYPQQVVPSCWGVTWSCGEPSPQVMVAVYGALFGSQLKDASRRSPVDWPSVAGTGLNI